jgi:hypothetical protein
MSSCAPPSGGQSSSASLVASCDQASLSVTSCPGCRSPIDPEGDFCERCQTWLKTGQCRFCYHDLPIDASFCVECGSPQAGFDCTRCGHHDYFDFCPGCGDPLSEAADAALKSLADGSTFAPSAMDEDPGDKSTLDARNFVSDVLPAVSENVDVAFMQSSQAPLPAPTVRRRLFSKDRLVVFDSSQSAVPSGATCTTAASGRTSEESDSRANFIDDSQRLAILAELAARDQAARGVAAAERQPIARVVERTVKQLLEESAQRAFASPQDARRFHMALGLQIERRRQQPKGWRCHRYGCVHRGPHECAAPQFGGVWLL